MAILKVSNMIISKAFNNDTVSLELVCKMHQTNELETPVTQMNITSQISKHFNWKAEQFAVDFYT